MRIDDNAEALAMMRRALGSLEAKIREAYNKGYQDGVKSKNSKHGYMWICPNCQLEVHSDFEECPRCGWKRNEPQTGCLTCRYWNPDHEAIACERCLEGKFSHYAAKDEPQTERSKE